MFIATQAYAELLSMLDRGLITARDFGVAAQLLFEVAVDG